MFGPNSWLSERDRVFFFIKYRVQNNKSLSQSERISREYIISKTGIWPNHFSRVIKALIKANAIEISENKNGVATYRLSRSRFGADTVDFDVKKPRKHAVDKPEKDVDKPCGQDVDNTNLVPEDESQHQNGVCEHQNGEAMGITRSLPLEPLEIILKARGRGGKDMFGFKENKTGDKHGLNQSEFGNYSLEWLNQTNGEIEFGVWLKQRSS